MVKNPHVSAGDIRDKGSIPGLGRSVEGGHGNPLQYSCLEKPFDRGAWQPTAHRLTKSDMTEVTEHTRNPKAFLVAGSPGERWGQQPRDVDEFPDLPRAVSLVKRRSCRTSLGVQWIRICLPMQGTQVRFLVWENSTYQKATKPIGHNY